MTVKLLGARAVAVETEEGLEGGGLHDSGFLDNNRN